MATKNGKVKAGKLAKAEKAAKPSPAGDVEFFKRLALSQYQSTRGRRARAGVFAWLARVTNEVARVQNLLGDDDFKGAFSAAEIQGLRVALDQAWTRLARSTEAIAVPSELTETHSLPIVGPLEKVFDGWDG